MYSIGVLVVSMCCKMKIQCDPSRYFANVRIGYFHLVKVMFKKFLVPLPTNWISTQKYNFVNCFYVIYNLVLKDLSICIII